MRPLSKSTAPSPEIPKPPAPQVPQPEIRSVTCEICGAPALFFDAVDFNKSCNEDFGVNLPRTGTMVDYFLCDGCGFCFAPEFRDWTLAEFSENIYNEDYVNVDPEYVFDRPNNSAQDFHRLYGPNLGRIRHLDYGGGSGLMSKALREKGWDSQSYDPIVEPEKDIAELGTFNLITAIEVFEHVPDVNQLADHMAKLCAPEGTIVFTTFCSDGQIERGQPLSWWYAAPRNGHISLYSRESLKLLMAKRGMSCVSKSPMFHMAFHSLPDWMDLAVT